MGKKRSTVMALLLLVLLGSGAFLFRSLLFGSLFGSEYGQPAYDVAVKDGNIEIRDYAGYVLAEVTQNGSFDRATNGSFRPLYGYITGANRSRQSMDMTTPVLVEPAGASKSKQMAMTVPVLVEPRWSAGRSDVEKLAGEEIDSWTMAFILPEGYTSDTAPLPTDKRVTLRAVTERKVASIRFSGRLGNESAERQRAKLAAWLDARSLEHQGDWKIATYDPPFTLPWFRRNEVLVTLR